LSAYGKERCGIGQPPRRNGSDYASFEEYFYSRKQWLFGLLAILFVADVADTFVKASAYARSLGAVYYARTISYIVFSAIAIKMKDKCLHAAFAILAADSEIALIVKSYMTLR
jgi:hypothetical protein